MHRPSPMFSNTRQIRARFRTKRMPAWVLLVALAVSWTGCGGGDETSPTPTPEPWEPPTPTPAPVANSWVSEGDDVARKLADPPYRYVRIVATFQADQSYTMAATDAEGEVFESSGDYVTKESTVPGIYRIMLFESYPNEIAYEGMYQIDTSTTPNVMQYEVVQVEPYAGLEPPDEQEGFGSTNGGAYGDDFVQIYRRQ